MAIFHLQRNKIFKAGTVIGVLAHDQGIRVTHGALGKIAYAHCQKHEDEGLDIVTDYRHKDVLATGHSLPDGTKQRDIVEVFREADNHKTKKEGVKQKQFKPVVGSELIGALPHELSDKQNTKLCDDVSRRIANEFRTANAWGIHPPDKGATTAEEKKNVHVHFAVLHRHIEPDGNLSTLNRDFNNRDCWRSDKKKGREIRDTATARVRLIWEETVNEHLARANRPERIDRRSNEERGIAQEPGKHRGAAETRALREERRLIQAAKLAANTRAISDTEIRKHLQRISVETEAESAVRRRDIRKIRNGAFDEIEPKARLAVGSTAAYERDVVGQFFRDYERQNIIARRRPKKQRRDYTPEEREAVNEHRLALRRAERVGRSARKLLCESDLGSLMIAAPNRSDVGWVRSVRQAVYRKNNPRKRRA